MTEIGTCRISLSGWNPRRHFEPEAFEELKKSIQQHGILEPLIVRTNPAHPEAGYELVAGERRFKAARELGLEQVPVVIKNLSDRDVREIMLIENLQRSGLEPLEEASALEVLLQDGSVTQEELGKKLGKSQAWIANRLRLLKAPDELKEMIISREITPKHALALLPYVEYPVLKEGIIPEMKDDMRRGIEVSVNRLKDIIENEITSDWDAERVLQLNDFPGEKDAYREYFDFSKCDRCKDLHIPPDQEIDPEDGDPDNEPPELDRYCLNRRCWADKLNIAKQKFEKTVAQQSDKLAKKDTVDTSKMNWQQYEEINEFDKWDKTECQDCNHRKKPAKQDKYLKVEFVCLNPPCAKEKESEYQKEKKEKERRETQQTYEELDRLIELYRDIRATSVIQNEGWTDNISLAAETLRGLIRILGEHLWTDAVKKAFKPWGSVQNRAKIAEITAKIPAEELDKALLRLCFMQQLERSFGQVNQKALDKAVALFEGKPVPKGYTEGV